MHLRRIDLFPRLVGIERGHSLGNFRGARPEVLLIDRYIHFAQGLIDDDGNVSNDGTRKFLQTFMDRYAA